MYFWLPDYMFSTRSFRYRNFDPRLSPEFDSPLLSEPDPFPLESSGSPQDEKFVMILL